MLQCMPAFPCVFGSYVKTHVTQTQKLSLSLVHVGALHSHQISWSQCQAEPCYLSSFGALTVVAQLRTTLQSTSTPAPPFSDVSNLISSLSVVTDACSIMCSGFVAALPCENRHVQEHSCKIQTAANGNNLVLSTVRLTWFILNFMSVSTNNINASGRGWETACAV